MSVAAAAATTGFSVPDALHATRPVETTGRRRDEVRMLVARPGDVAHVQFRDVGDHLAPGDLLVVNTSATLPAAVDGIHPGGAPVTVHFSSPDTPGRWIVELRGVDWSCRGSEPGEPVYLPGGARLEVVAPHRGERLWSARFDTGGTVERYLARYGRPITYDYVSERWPLAAYQTIFSRHPGSAEMPSAARPFTNRLVTDLVGRGIAIAPVVLHCGVSSLEAGELPQEERYEVPAATARLVNETRRAGARVVATGTTVARALESAARRDGTVVPRAGVTDLVLSAARPARAIDGLVTGWHPPGASHLSLLEAVAGSDLVREAYDDAVAQGYLWHEFGDSCLLLPEPRRAVAREAA